MAKKLGKALLFTAVASAAAGAALYLLKKKETPVPSEEAEDEDLDDYDFWEDEESTPGESESADAPAEETPAEEAPAEEAPAEEMVHAGIVTGDVTLTDVEKDAIGEVANISMGTSATTLYSLVNSKVDITTPVVSLATWQDVLDYYEKPCVFIQIKYTTGIDGHNILILKE